MGALPYGGGVTFRVWAPSANAVCVAGTFNGWSANAAPLTHESGGYWSTDVPGAGVGDRYKFVLTTPFAAAPLWKNDPYARSLTHSNGDSIVADPDYTWHDPGYSTPAWNSLVLYELHVGSFLFDAAHHRRGNFDTVVSKLDELVDLGVNGILVMAADEFPGDVSWGYNPAYIFAIEESYGGPNGFRRLVDAAHERGIAVIFDVVYNHLGPDDLDLWRFNGWSPDGYEHQGGIYFYNDWRAQTLWGHTRPDYGRGEVRQYLRDNALRWLEQRHCDGLRWDATGWIRNVHGRNDDPGSDVPDGWSLMQWINSQIRERQPWKLIIAEDMQDNAWLTKDVAAGGAGFGSQWAAGFVHTLRRTLIAPDDRQRSMQDVRAILAQRFNGNAFQRVIYTESHDEVSKQEQARVPEMISPGNADGYFAQKRSTLGAAVVFTAPGIPMIFMGQEFLEWGFWSDARELDWSKASRLAGIRQLYRDLIRLRRNWFDTTRGLRGHDINVHHVNDGDKVIAFHRWDQGGARDDVVVVLNFAARAYASYRIGLPRGGQWHVRFNSDWRGYSALFGDHPSFDPWAEPGANGDGMPFGADVGLGAYSAVILSQD
ncbi:alpha amylase C-terminal domain-containing protein [Candidatus Binatia bacterium]|nr:alpha amylase C-terminal domain-containing protein [Candidatus Binatia bacterium]